MKKLLFAYFWLLTFITYSQETYEETIFFEGQGTVTLETGDTQSGKLRFYPNAPRRVFFLEEGAEKQEKIKIGDAKGFTITDQVWEKVINTGAIGANNDYFMERLTPEDRYITVYKYVQQNTIGTEQGFLVTREYYVGIEGWDEVYSVGAMKFTPFHKKGSKLLSDCPELAKKISKKQDGYKIGLISTDPMKAEVFLTVSEEYANCQ